MKVKVPRASGRAFQLTAEEVRAAPDVVAGTYFPFLFIYFKIYCAYSMLYLGTFHVSYLPALVLFDSGASRTFMSLAFSRHISIRCEALSRSLRVSIADKRMVFSTNVFRGCVMEIFCDEFPIDLVSITMGNVCVIVGMD